MKLRQLATVAIVFLVPAGAFASGATVLRDGTIVPTGSSRLLAAGLVDGHSNALVVGYGAGLSKSIDFEAKALINADFQAFGGGVNYQALSRMQQAFDMTIGGGFFYTVFDGGHETTVDLTGIGSKPLNDKTTLYGGLKIEINNNSFGGLGSRNVNTVTVVPGIQFKLNPQVNVVAELGLGLNANAGNYVAGGIHYYFK